MNNATNIPGWCILRFTLGTSLAIQWLRLCASTAGDTSSILGQELRSWMLFGMAKKPKKKKKDAPWMKSAREGEKIVLLPGRHPCSALWGFLLFHPWSLERRDNSGGEGKQRRKGILSTERLVGARQWPRCCVSVAFVSQAWEGAIVNPRWQVIRVGQRETNTLAKVSKPVNIKVRAAKLYKEISLHVRHCARTLSCVRLFATPWTTAHQAPPSIEFSRQEYWGGLPCPPPRDLPNPRIKPASHVCHVGRWVLYH